MAGSKSLLLMIFIQPAAHCGVKRRGSVRMYLTPTHVGCRVIVVVCV